jgi:hypothetical protein
MESGDDFGSAATQFSSKISESTVEYARWRFELQLENWVPVLISRSAGTQFSSMIFDLQ